MKNHIFLVILVTFIVSCSSLHKKAEQSMKSKNYEEAINIYTQILQKKPKDNKAIDGLAKAKQGYVDNGLIQVRMMRIGNNQLGAIELLNTLIQKENQWTLRLDAGMAYTQKEELNFGINYMIDSIFYPSLKEKQYLKTEFDLKKYSSIVAIYKEDPQILKVKSIVERGGAQKCRLSSAIANKESFFLNKHFTSLCNHYGEMFADVSTTSKDATRYNALNVEIKTTEGFSKFNPDLTQSLKDSFSKTLWFSSVGSSVATLVANQVEFLYDHQSKRVNQSHTYTVKVPYMDTENYTQEIDDLSKPLRTYKSFDIKTKKDIVVTEYAKKKITQTRQVKKERDEDRYYVYVADQHDEALKISFNTQINILGTDILIPYSTEFKNTFISHKELNPNISLYPVAEKFLDKDKWIKDQIAVFTGTVTTKLGSQWELVYCDSVDSVKSDQTKYAEYIIRCANINPTHKIVTEWFTNNYGLNYNDFKVVVGN